MYSIQYIYICIDVVLLVSEIQIKKGLHSVNAVQITGFFLLISKLHDYSVGKRASFLLFLQAVRKYPAL